MYLLSASINVVDRIFASWQIIMAQYKKLTKRSSQGWAIWTKNDTPVFINISVYLIYWYIAQPYLVSSTTKSECIQRSRPSPRPSYQSSGPSRVRTPENQDFRNQESSTKIMPPIIKVSVRLCYVCRHIKCHASLRSELLFIFPDFEQNRIEQNIFICHCTSTTKLRQQLSDTKTIQNID